MQILSNQCLLTKMFSISRNNSASQADYMRTPKSPQIGGVPFKPVPPPKPKNYRPPVNSGNWENAVSRLFFNIVCSL